MRKSAEIERPLDHRGLRILAEIAGYMAAGLSSDDVLQRVAGALCRGLLSDACRVWVRTPDGAGFRAFVSDGDRLPGPDYAQAVARWVSEREWSERDGQVWRLRFPLVHEGEELGLLEATLDDGDDAPTLRHVVKIVADILSPLLAAIELSEDLASEVALGTREIEAQRRFTAKIIDSLPVGLYVVNRQYRIQAWNRKRETGTLGIGRDEVLGRTVFEVLQRQPKALLQREFDRVFTTGQIEQMEVESEAQGEIRHYRISKIPMRLDDDDVTHVITIGEDITAWVMVQQRIAETEKLAAIGQLAAGVMHEINNPLATIGACVEALGVRAEEVPPAARQGLEEYLRIIDSELGRCKAIVDGLLDFSRPKARVKRPARLNQVVEDALFLVRHHKRFKRITLERDLAADLPRIHANIEQLIQVFLALMLNAIDAMEGQGVLTVRTGRNPERSDELFVEFRDTGAGIPREELPKIFEPFFTTKQPGRGTGLGLSICYGIVQEHRGRILVDSQVDHGTVFKVVLPIGDGPEREA